VVRGILSYLKFYEPGVTILIQYCVIIASIRGLRDYFFNWITNLRIIALKDGCRAKVVGHARIPWVIKVNFLVQVKLTKVFL